MVYLDGVGVDHWDEERIFLKGSVRGIVPGDEICVVFMYPASSIHHNILSTISEVQYIYFKGTSGDYDLADRGRYIPRGIDGMYAVRIVDVSGTCENWSGERGITPFLFVYEPVPVPPVIFQYEVIFDFEDPRLGDYKALLEAEYAKYEAADQWLVTPVEPDCFSQLEPIIGGKSGDRETGWLCQAVEYGPSPCAPLPYWLCPWPSPETIYMRGECSCDLFQEELQPLGIPCAHLIAAMNWYAGKPVYCPYVQCP